MLYRIREVQAEHHLDQRMRIYFAPKLLIIDEFGVWPDDHPAAITLLNLRLL